MQIKISPSILSADFANLGAECQDVLKGGADWLHIDVMDGVFVPNISLGVPVLKGLSKAVSAFYDVHLMITKPDAYISAFAKAGANLITFHLESESDVTKTIHQIHEAGCQAGISICPDTPIESVYPSLELVDLVLVMSVNPGFGGQKFMPHVIEKIAKLRQYANQMGKHSLMIQVDGGIDECTAPACVQAGADVLVAGSAIFGRENREDAIKKICLACQQKEKSC